MNLIPSNALFDIIQSDISLLPSATQWMPLCVCEGEEVSLSQSDISAAFYLFNIPSCWQLFMCFSFKAKGCDIDLAGLESGVRPTCRAVPTGWAPLWALCRRSVGSFYCQGGYQLSWN